MGATGTRPTASAGQGLPATDGSALLALPAALLAGVPPGAPSLRASR